LRIESEEKATLRIIHMNFEYVIFKLYLGIKKLKNFQSIAWRVSIMWSALLFWVNIGSIYFFLVSAQWMPERKFSDNTYRLFLVILFIALYTLFRNKESVIVEKYSFLIDSSKKKHNKEFWIYIGVSVLLFISCVLLRLYLIKQHS
jgi:hypothetical protein